MQLFARSRLLGPLAALLLHAACAPGDAVQKAPASPSGPTDASTDEIESAPVAAPSRTANPLVGSDLTAQLDRIEWLATRPRTRPAELTLYRWWTTGCPFCRSSLPDLDRLAERHADRLRVVGIYHQKGARPWTEAELENYAERTGYTRGDLATDRDWGVLREVMRAAHLDKATSISVLVDAQNRVVWVHEGPRLHRSERYPEADSAMRELEKLLGE